MPPLLSVESKLPWLAELAGAPFPNRREEAWRFTDLAPLRDLESTVLPPVDPLAGVPLPKGVSRLDPVEWTPLLDASLVATCSGAAWPVELNRAADPQVLALRVTGEAEPLELAWDAGIAKGLTALRVLLVLEPGSSLDVLEVVSSSGANCTSLITEVVLAENARLNLGVLALGHPMASLLAHVAVKQEPGSALSCTTATAGWGLARLEPRVMQSVGSAQTRLRGLQLVDGQQLADTHSFMSFGGPAGELDQVHKVVANGSGRSVFNGAVKVPKAAQQTNASQLSRSLLLSDRARVDTKPELEIVADDVKCAHGATVSQLQANELFYLQSRGIGADQAARLLLRGYCDEVLRELPAMASAWHPLARMLGDGA